MKESPFRKVVVIFVAIALMFWRLLQFVYYIIIRNKKGNKLD